jgi:hypothetical protein
MASFYIGLRHATRNWLNVVEGVLVTLLKCGVFHSVKEPKDAILDLSALTNAKADTGGYHCKGFLWPRCRPAMISFRLDSAWRGACIPQAKPEWARDRFTKARVDTI